MMWRLWIYFVVILSSGSLKNNYLRQYLCCRIFNNYYYLLFIAVKNELCLKYICIPVHLKQSLIIIVFIVFTRWDYHSPNMGHKLVCYLFRRLLTGLRKHFNWAQRDLGQNNPAILMTCTVTDNEWRFFLEDKLITTYP